MESGDKHIYLYIPNKRILKRKEKWENYLFFVDVYKARKKCKELKNL